MFNSQSDFKLFNKIYLYAHLRTHPHTHNKQNTNKQNISYSGMNENEIKQETIQISTLIKHWVN